MSRLALLITSALLLTTACDDATEAPDAGAPTADAGPEPDGGPGPGDGGPDDSGSGSDAGPDVDAGPGDAGGDAGEPDAGLDGGPALDPTTQITLVRGTAPGAISPALPVEGATVTYVRAVALGDDPASFFVQGSSGGPALLVAVDPSGLDPAPAAGDVVSFEVSETARTSDQLRVTALSGWARLGGGADVGALVQDLSAAIDADQVERYESELVRARGTLMGGEGGGGPGHRRFSFATAAAVLDLRLPIALIDDALVGDGCDVTVGPSPMWRFGSAAQLMAYEAAHLTVHSCPAPAVRSASASDPTHVTVRFSRQLDAASVQAGDFSFVGGALTASAVAVDRDTVLVTTSTMSQGVTYTVLVSGLDDALGTPIGSMNNASFRGLGAGAASLVLTEYVEGTASNRALEITNLGDAAIDLATCELRLYSNGGTTAATHALPVTTLSPGGSFVVCNASSSTALMARCNEIDTTPTNFNGDDALELWCGGALVDSFGDVGDDPGVAWSSGAVSTLNQTLRRRCGIAVGDPISDDAFDPAIEWVSAELDEVSDLGVHCP